MARGKKHTAEEIIGKLREAEVHLSHGSTQELAARQIGVAYQTSYCSSAIYPNGYAIMFS